MHSNIFKQELQKKFPKDKSKQQGTLKLALSSKQNAMAGSLELQAAQGYIEEEDVDLAVELAGVTALDFVGDELSHIISGGKGGGVIRESYKADIAKLYGLRLRSDPNHTISARNLTALINANLFNYIEDDMGGKSLNSGVTPNSVTGRMAHSFLVTGLNAGSQGDVRRELSVVFRYQTEPYKVFGTGSYSKYTSAINIGKSAIKRLINDLIITDTTKIFKKNIQGIR